MGNAAQKLVAQANTQPDMNADADEHFTTRIP